MSEFHILQEKQRLFSTLYKQKYNQSIHKYLLSVIYIIIPTLKKVLIQFWKPNHKCTN